MKKYNLSKIMKRAWEIVKKFGETISSALKKAWKEAKMAKESMEEKLVENGYKVWEKYGKKRIYINDFEKYMDVQVIEGGMGRGRIVNGISTEKCNAHLQRNVLSLIDGTNGMKFFYDCIDNEFHWSNTSYKTIEAIMKSIASKLRNM